MTTEFWNGNMAAAQAVKRFCASVEGSIPVILRFSGPRPEESRPVLTELAQNNPAVVLADAVGVPSFQL